MFDSNVQLNWLHINWRHKLHSVCRSGTLSTFSVTFLRLFYTHSASKSSENAPCIFCSSLFDGDGCCCCCCCFFKMITGSCCALLSFDECCGSIFPLHCPFVCQSLVSISAPAMLFSPVKWNFSSRQNQIHKNQLIPNSVRRICVMRMDWNRSVTPTEHTHTPHTHTHSQNFQIRKKNQKNKIKILEIVTNSLDNKILNN